MPPLTDAEQFELFESAPREEESLFSRDALGELIRREEAKREEFEKFVTVKIDGIPIRVRKAVPKTDFLGNERLDSDGLPIPRATTIYDAAAKIWKDDPQELQRRIPVLCHREHLDPVAVCRLCSVSASRGEGKVVRKLVPACQHEVRDGMEVTTRGCTKEDGAPTDAAKAIEESVAVLTQLLATDHLHANPETEGRFRNELKEINDSCEPRLRHLPSLADCVAEPGSRNAPLHARSRQQLPVDAGLEGTKGLPYSSRSILVNHDNCILCDRCVRSCTDVREFRIIGHSGKGYRTRIAFDLDRGMNASDCTQCGECATACPTGALVFRRRVAPAGWDEYPRVFDKYDQDLKTDHSAVHRDFAEPLPSLPPERRRPRPAAPQLERLARLESDKLLTADEMLAVTLPACGDEGPYQPFAGIPYSYLKWNEGAVRRRPVLGDEVDAGGKVIKEGEYLCREGDYASTAYFIQSGRFGIFDEPSFNRIATSDYRDRVLGEMACLSGRARNKAIRVLEDGVIYEVTRNMLDMMRRTAQGRAQLEQKYIERAASDAAYESILFKNLTKEEQQKVFRTLVGRPVEGTPPVGSASSSGAAKPEARSAGPVPAKARDERIRRCKPGERIVTEGDKAADFYIIRVGFVEVTKRVDGREIPIRVLGKGMHFGEIALLYDHPLIIRAMAEMIPPAVPSRVRTASVTALDHAELLRVPGNEFRAMLKANPSLYDHLAEGCVLTVGRKDDPPSLARQQRLDEYIRLGLYQAQNLLLLDLESCTRCDECTRACADSHGDKHSRLLRDGQRFDHFLVATCCRSCHKPYCLEGCPVDAIHRKGRNLEVLIDSHCIGCTLCERNCPYGAIQMGKHKRAEAPPPGGRGVNQSYNCDLCSPLIGKPGDTPFCVRACPHDAAMRITDGQDNRLERFLLAGGKGSGK